MDRRLREYDFQRAADLLGVETAVIKAITAVESGPQGGFLPSGRITILFEGHVFWRELKAIGIDPATRQEGNEDILHERWTKKNYRGGEAEYGRIMRAIAINRMAALRATSWGIFQIMGFNHELCGQTRIGNFIHRMKNSEGEQLAMFCRYIESCKLTQYLKTKDWAGFAKRYNGPRYAANRYDERLAEAYRAAL